MAKEPIGITFIVPDDEDPIGVYESDGGIEVFETDEPYLLSDGKSLVDPMPVRMVGGPIYQDTLGNAQSALAITLLSSWSPADLFANGETGSFWGPLPYYSDPAGTVEADWGDPVGLIPDAYGDAPGWTQVTSTARPILGRVPVGGRRNLLRYTEDFGGTGWFTTAASVSANVILAPDGTLSADKIVEDSATSAHSVRRTVDTIAGGTYSFSFYAKAGERNRLNFYLTGALLGARINLTTGAVERGSAITEAVGDGWWRIVATGTEDVTGVILAYIELYNGGASYTGDGTSGIYIWGAQLETGSTATPYQRVGNEYDITEAGVKGIHYLRFDGTDDQVTTTLPAISGGTIVLAGTNGIWIDEINFAGGEFSVGPDTYTGGPAGLMSILGDIIARGCFVIDRALTPEEIAQVKGYYVARGSAGLFELGPELVVNGDFSSADGWTLEAGWSIGAGVLSGTSTVSEAYRLDTAISTGNLLLASADISGYVGGSVTLKSGGNFGTGVGVSNGKLMQIITAGSGGRKASVDGAAVFTGNIDNVSFRKLELIP